MNPSLTGFREKYQELLLSFLWRQWSALGVAGQTRSEDDWISDPEGLLLFTCTLGRRDPRLFDEVLDWLHKNGRFLNIHRLKRMLRTERFAGGDLLAAIAGMMSRGADVLKWKQLAARQRETPAPEGLFFRKGGQMLPVAGESDPEFARYGFVRGPVRLRGYSRRFHPTDRTNLTLQLRALFGINARCEIILYLLTHDAAHPSQIARDSYYFQRTVQSTLVEMMASGVVNLRGVRREKHYWIRPEHWAVLLNRKEPFPRWITWPPLLSALERIWLKINDPKLLTLNPLLQSSELRQLMVQVRPSIEQSGFDKALSDDRQHLGATYIPVFLSDITRILELGYRVESSGHKM